MGIYSNIGLLLIVSIASVMCQTTLCPTNYGDCKPELDPSTGRCINPRDPVTNKLKCFNCCDGGFVSREKVCNGLNDCTKGTDERYCDVSPTSRKFSTCVELKDNCTESSQCCSGICKDEKCWDERCDTGMNLRDKRSYDYCRICRNEESYFDCKDCLEQNGCDWKDVKHSIFPKRGAHCWCKKPC